jgi:ketosteroid isomerase-like protein
MTAGTTSSVAPRAVFERLIGDIAAQRWHTVADLYAEDAVVDILFALPEPRRLEGRETIRAHFAAAAAGPLRFEVYDVTVHETADPEVVVAEFWYRGHVAGGDRSFEAANVQVLRVRDGLIVSSRDYHNHAAIAAALAR